MANFNKGCQMFASIIYLALFGSNWGGTILLELLLQRPSAWVAASHSSWGCVIGLSTMVSVFLSRAL